MSNKPRRFRRKYLKGTAHKGGPPCGQGENHGKNRDRQGKKIRTPGKFSSIPARIKARTKAWKKHKKEN